MAQSFAPAHRPTRRQPRSPAAVGPVVLATLGVRVDARATSARELTITVEDDGPGLAAKDRAEVLQRGARLDEAAPGSGLGLSIVDELAKAYGGALRLEDSLLGGLKVTLVLPRVEA